MRRHQPANYSGSAEFTAGYMLGDITACENIYIVCGQTDMRKSIDVLAAIVQEQLYLDPFSDILFLFCGRNRNRIKAFLWESDGFILLYKRLENESFLFSLGKHCIIKGLLQFKLYNVNLKIILDRFTVPLNCQKYLLVNENTL